MKKINLNKLVIYFIHIFLLIVFLYISVYFFNLSKNNYSNTINYKVLDDSYYDVYYLNNNLVNGKSNEDSFIKKYIDRININYDYKLEFSELVNLDMSYTVKVTMIVYSPNGKSIIYRSNPEYLIKDKKDIYKDIKEVNNNPKVTIDYSKYLKMYEEFKENTDIYSSSKILVEFMNNSSISYLNLDTINENNFISYDIPLTDSVIEISKNSNINGIEKSKSDNSNIEINKKYFNFTMLSLLLSLVNIIVFLYVLKRSNRKNNYNKRLKKILRSYDSIIVNIKKMPKIDGKKLVEVTKFSELVDAQMELRKPINFVESKSLKESLFMIITSDVIWVYKLLEEDL